MYRLWCNWIIDAVPAIVSGAGLSRPNEGDYSVASLISGRMGAGQAQQYCRSQHCRAVGDEKDRWRRIESAVRHLAREESLSHYWP